MSVKQVDKGIAKANLVNTEELFALHVMTCYGLSRLEIKR
jgi:hypothetical protein